MKSKTVIITGTSRGIGFELAQLFANNNFNVIALSRNTKTLKAINHPKIKTFGIDLSKENEIETDPIKFSTWVLAKDKLLL